LKRGVPIVPVACSGADHGFFFMMAIVSLLEAAPAIGTPAFKRHDERAFLEPVQAAVGTARPSG